MKQTMLFAPATVVSNLGKTEDSFGMDVVVATFPNGDCVEFIKEVLDGRYITADGRMLFLAPLMVCDRHTFYGVLGTIEQYHQLFDKQAILDEPNLDPIYSVWRPWWEQVDLEG